MYPMTNILHRIVFLFFIFLTVFVNISRKDFSNKPHGPWDWEIQKFILGVLPFADFKKSGGLFPLPELNYDRIQLSAITTDGRRVILPPPHFISGFEREWFSTRRENDFLKKLLGQPGAMGLYLQRHCQNFSKNSLTNESLAEIRLLIERYRITSPDDLANGSDDLEFLGQAFVGGHKCIATF